MKPQHRSPNQNNALPVTFCLNQGLSELTYCEWKILLHIADDLTNAEIAEKHALTLKSVENYRTRIGAKLDLKGHHKLAKFARKHVVALRQRHEELLRELPPPKK